MPAQYGIVARQGDRAWRYVVNTPIVQIGSGAHNDITLYDAEAAHTHVRLRMHGSAWRIEHIAVDQLRSGKRTLRKGDDLHVNDVFYIGAVELKLVEVEADLLDETVLDANAVPLPGDALAVDVSLPNTHVPRLAIRADGRVWELPLKPGITTIGRAPENDVDLSDPKASRRHAQIEIDAEGAAHITDLRSANGTRVNGEKITSRALEGSETIQIGQTVLVYKPAFEPEALVAPTSRNFESMSARRKPVVFVPGFMGSQLRRDGALVWPDLKLLLTKPEQLALPEATPSSVDGLVGDVVVVPGLFKLEQYSQFTSFLRESLGYDSGTDLLEFAYDWRKDLRLAAARLKADVEAFRARQPNPDTKVFLIAHSMGCLVSRYFIDVLGGDKIVERLILMGGPHQGTPKIISALLTGKGLLPIGLINDRIREAVATFPGAYQLLPTYPAVFGADQSNIDVFADARWAEEPYRGYIEDARAFRAELSPKARIPTLCIVGYGNKTILRATVAVDASGQWRNPSFLEGLDGDATIPVSSAILDGADFHPVQQSHGALFVDNDVKFRLRLELTKS